MRPEMARPGRVRRFTAGGPKRFLLASSAGLLGAWMTSALALPALALATGLVSGRFDPLTVALSPLLPIVWLPFPLLPAVLGGMAMHLSLAALGLRGARAYALAGAPAGFALAAMLYACFGAGGLARMGSPKALVLGVAVGAAPGLGGALAFWTVLRPDLEQTGPEVSGR